MFSTNPELAESVRERVIRALGPHVPADEARIVVGVTGDCAHLRGCVRSWEQHACLERAALETPGIARVDNRLAILVEAKLSEPQTAVPVA